MALEYSQLHEKAYNMVVCFETLRDVGIRAILVIASTD